MNEKLNNQDINNYGIIYTCDFLVNKILDLIPKESFSNPNLKWLDLGAGNGAFTINLYNRLDNGLKLLISDNLERSIYIIENMIYMIEIYEPHILKLKTIFKDINSKAKINLITKDFLSINKYEYPYFDFIIGNPPYNINGKIKTPTNNIKEKKLDGKTIYTEFVRKSLDMLHDNGYLNLIIPNLWLKPDKAGLYNLLTNLDIIYLNSLSTSESYKLFNYKAQTPTCFFLIKKRDTSKYNYKTIDLYDKYENKYITYKLLNNYPIPTHGINIINKLLKYVELYGIIKIYKSNTPCKNSKIYDNREIDSFVNIKTCLIDKKKPKIIYNYSNIEQKYSNISKLVLAHKMYGFPYFDISGSYGISTRDNYIISSKNYSIEDLEKLQYFLSTKFALFIFSVANYRMRFLEKYAFEFIPDITKINNFPFLKNIDREIRDKKIGEYFDFSQKEIKIIENSSINYEFFV
tara:strand:- start:195 stop:1580 length:1386 start_codon:yes stop_codon:yes gene_type:complete